MKLVEHGHRVKGLTPAGEALLDEAKALRACLAALR